MRSNLRHGLDWHLFFLGEDLSVGLRLTLLNETVGGAGTLLIVGTLDRCWRALDALGVGLAAFCRCGWRWTQGLDWAVVGSLLITDAIGKSFRRKELKSSS